MDQQNTVFNPVTEQTDCSEFRVGIRVLAVDSDLIHLRDMISLLEQCRYKVTGTTSGVEALELLREAETKFDIIIMEVNVLDMDVFKLMDIVNLEIGIPVVLVSGDDNQENITRGMNHGAQDFLSKPLRLQELKKIWRHVLRTNFDVAPHKPSLTNETSTSQRRSREAEEEESVVPPDDASRPPKKQRLTWTKELHELFLAAIQHLGSKDAVPNNILKFMNISGLTRENVASHLQKHRNSMKKKSAEVCHSNRGIIGLNCNAECSTSWRSHPVVNAIENTQLPVDISCGVLNNVQPRNNYFDHVGLQNPLLASNLGVQDQQLHPGGAILQDQQVHSQAVTQQFHWPWPPENLPSTSSMAYANPPLQQPDLSLRPRPVTGYWGLPSNLSSNDWTHCQTDPSGIPQSRYVTASGISEVIQTGSIPFQQSSAAWPGQNFQTWGQNEGGWSLNLNGSGELKYGGQAVRLPENAKSPVLSTLKQEDEHMRQLKFEKGSTSHDIGFGFSDDDLIEKF